MIYQKKSIKTSLALDTSLSKKELGWKVKTDLDNGIIKTLQWYKKTIYSFSKKELYLFMLFFLLIDFVYQFNVSSIPLSILYS